MKKFKNYMLMLALALLFVGAMGMTKASAEETGGNETQNQATPTPTASASNITSTTNNYSDETIKVVSEKQVYYQIVKAADQKSGLKTANWIKAATDGEAYYIDFSATANGKDAFFALTTDNAKGDAEAVVTVDSVVKSVKVALNYKTEAISDKGLADIIASLNVKGVDKGNEKADAKAADYQLKWKRGANGAWADADDFDQLNWDMLKASNGTLYIAIDGTLKNGELDKSFRMSKEAKVKIPKSAKAPTVKVDYVKGTIALKNGMQVRVNADTDWMDVVAYDKASKGTAVFALASANATTATKVSNVTVADFVKAVKDDSILNQDTDVEAGDSVTLTVRTAATDKKFPSMEGTVSFVLPKAAPTVAADAVAVTYTKADKAKKVAAAYELDFSKLFTKADGTKYSDYEYVLVGKEADGLNLAKQKWTKLPESGKVDLAKNIGKDAKYFKAADEKTATGVVKYEAITAVYIRLAAVKATKTEVGVFASDYDVATVTVSEKAGANATPTPTPTQPAAPTTYSLTVSAAGTTVVTVGEEEVTAAAAEATVKVAYTVSNAETKAVQSVVISYTVEGEEATTTTLQAQEGVYSFTMPAANVTITITETTVS